MIVFYFMYQIKNKRYRDKGILPHVDDESNYTIVGFSKSAYLGKF